MDSGVCRQTFAAWQSSLFIYYVYNHTARQGHPVLCASAEIYLLHLPHQQSYHCQQELRPQEHVLCSSTSC